MGGGRNAASKWLGGMAPQPVTRRTLKAAPPGQPGATPVYGSMRVCNAGARVQMPTQQKQMQQQQMQQMQQQPPQPPQAPSKPSKPASGGGFMSALYASVMGGSKKAPPSSNA